MKLEKKKKKGEYVAGNDRWKMINLNIQSEK